MFVRFIDNLIGLQNIRREVKKTLMTKGRESLEKYDKMSEILLKKNAHVCGWGEAGVWPLRRRKTEYLGEDYKEQRASQSQHGRERHQKLILSNG